MTSADVTPPVLGPVTLAEALVAWGDPAAVAEMQRLDQQGYSGPQPLVVPGANADEPFVRRYRHLHEQLERSLIAKLQDGTLVATGHDSRATIDAPAVTVPADRWRVLRPDFERSVAADKEVEITRILVAGASNVVARAGYTATPRLHLIKAARSACLNGSDLKLTPRSFELLVILADSAVRGTAPVPIRQLENELLQGRYEDKQLAKAVYRLRAEIVNCGLTWADVKALIVNARSVGYRLTVPGPEIKIQN